MVPRRTASGRQNLATQTLLAMLGLRADEVVALTLAPNDIV